MSGALYSQLYLASASPRRQELLTQLGVDFVQVINDFDETQDSQETPLEYVQRLAEGKAHNAVAKVGSLDKPLLAADTIVVLQDKCLGKPKNLTDAAATLRLLSGKTHQVFTSIYMLDQKQRAQATSITRVTFETLTESQIKAYCQTQESLGKAGSYAIQGVAASLIARIEGSYSGVMGLPLKETRELLDRFQIKYLLSL
ncbi:nucleoside triphosphate pyrophosphatase [Kangiella sp. TOML190]|uniref:Maf family protein n=1 Tax=Kangiella sp. TOML190 TaxID=2931351 RepID=UPI002559F267|nr:Maf family protein [Kangiella sp. TOML190]